MPIDLDSARDRFESSRDLTVGIEEEFALLDPATHELVQRFEELAGDGRASDPVLADSLVGELISSEIEIRSGRGEDLQDALSRQRDRRARLFALARRHDVALAATGTHPWADYREQRIIDTPHYRLVEESLKYAAWRNTTFSLHVHVGVRGPGRAVAVCDRLRPVLPTLLAISASSPYLDARDSGLHSARSQAFTRTFPRCGVPDALGDWETFADFVALLVAVGSIVEYTQVWWSVRPHLDYGTVEVRVCDAQPTAGESEALCELIVACIAQAARDHDEGRPVADLPDRMIEENLWRAIRHGLDGELIDFERRAARPVAAAAEGLLEWTAPVRAEVGVEPALPERNSAQRQRRAIEEGVAMAEVYARCVRETHETYVQEVPA